MWASCGWMVPNLGDLSEIRGLARIETVGIGPDFVLDDKQFDRTVVPIRSGQQKEIL